MNMDGSDLSIMLHSPEQKQGVGMLIPIKIEVRNLSQQSVWIVGVVDGSEDAIRYPHYLPRISMAGQVVAEPPPPEDPLVGPLRLVDFRLLVPGEVFDPTRPHPGATFLPISTFSNQAPSRHWRYGHGNADRRAVPGRTAVCGAGSARHRRGALASARCLCHKAGRGAGAAPRPAWGFSEGHPPCGDGPGANQGSAGTGAGNPVAGRQSM